MGMMVQMVEMQIKPAMRARMRADGRFRTLSEREQGGSCSVQRALEAI
jgi:hypothetical protein